ncbi:MAG: DUF1553 domain-containing protein [Planctomycetes bacterium]|nr:DUF1553 domain-containing protein [Planctomycetota bacterium]
MNRRIFLDCRIVLVLFVPVAVLHGIAAQAEEPSAELNSPTRFVSLAVYPAQVALNHADDFQQMLAVATRADGVTLDVTKLANWQLAEQEPSQEKPGVIVFNSGQLTATADGTAEITIEFAGLQASADVRATHIEQKKPVSYRHDIVPIFLRAGCNSGSCHGSSRGKDGFRLSIFGFDLSGDYHRLTHELATRRLNYALPDESLLLLKATGAVPHTGGKKIDLESDYYRKLLRWIAAGAINDLAGAPTVDSLAIYPPSAAMGIDGQTQQFVAVATYSDGTTRDVSSLALFQTSNDVSAAITADGLVTSAQPGEAFIMARFDTHTVGSQVLVLRTDKPYEPSNEAPANYIDELVNQKLRTLRIYSSPLCTDEEFLRRVSLDISGRLPKREEHDTFLASKSPTKRAEKIDELLAEPQFAQLWAQKWAELLLIRTEPNRVEYKPMFLYWEWLTEQITAGRPLDEMIRELLSSSGSTFDTPTTNFYQIDPDQKKVAENVAQSFLGIRIQCAQCHNHPFDRWTMDDYYSFTAFFSQIARKRSDDYREWMIYNSGGGEMRHPIGGRVMKPKFLGGAEPELKGRDRRAALADWIVSSENPYFAVSVANRVWAHFLGSGIVEPVDDIRVSNPPSNPALFNKLGEQLVGYDFDIRRLVRDICNSNTYQRTCDTNESNAKDTANFARAQPRRILAEVLLDCLVQATGQPESLPGLPAGSRAVQIADGRASNYFLTTFGRSKRETVCACEAKAEPTLSQALHMLNGNTVHQKIAQGGLVKKWLAAKKTSAEVIDEIYLRCLSRPPTDEERDRLVATLPTEKPNLESALQDVFWAVLNSREFLFNH